MLKTFGFDIDGVLTADDDGRENLWMVEACRYFDRPLLKPSFHLHEALGVPVDDVKQFIQDRGTAIMEQVPVRPHCPTLLTALHVRGCTIHLITARPASYLEITLDWLRRHSIPYDTLTMKHPQDPTYAKGARCVELGVEFFVDDHYENCVDLKQTGIYTLMYRCSHNRSKEPLVPVVRDWYDIDRQIAVMAT